MASITIRNLDDDVKERLRVRAAGNGRSMEAEVRELLEAAVANPYAGMNIGQAIRKMAESVGYMDEVVIAPREPMDMNALPYSDEQESNRDADAS